MGWRVESGGARVRGGANLDGHREGTEKASLGVFVNRVGP